MTHAASHSPARRDLDAERRSDLLTHERNYRSFTRLIRWAGLAWLVGLAILIRFVTT